MLRQIIVLVFAAAMALAWPLAAPAGQDIISGTPTWQNVPVTQGQQGYVQSINGQSYWFQTGTNADGQTVVQNIELDLGYQYGYWWTATNGDQLFIQCDQTTGQPVAAVDYTQANLAAQNFQYTKQVQETEYDTITIDPPMGLAFVYPGGNGGAGYTDAPMYDNEVFTTAAVSSNPYNNYGAIPFLNAGTVPLVVNLSGAAGSLGSGTGGQTSTTVTLPANSTYYLYVPMTVPGTFDFIGSSGVTGAIGSDGKTYPIIGYSYWDNLFENLQISVNSNGVGQTSNNLVRYAQGFVTYQEFQPVLNSVVGDLEPVQVPGIVITSTTVNMPSLNVTGPMTITGDASIQKNVGQWESAYDECWYFNQNFYEPTGYVTATIYNPTPLQIIGGGGSVEFASSYGTGTLTLPSSFTVPPNSSAVVNMGVIFPPIVTSYGRCGPSYASVSLSQGTHSGGWFENYAGWSSDNSYDATFGTVYLSSVDGANYAFYDARHFVSGGYEYGDFWNGRGWAELGSPQQGSDGSPYQPQSMSLSLPVWFN